MGAAAGKRRKSGDDGEMRSAEAESALITREHERRGTLAATDEATLPESAFRGFIHEEEVSEDEDSPREDKDDVSAMYPDDFEPLRISIDAVKKKSGSKGTSDQTPHSGSASARIVNLDMKLMEENSPFKRRGDLTPTSLAHSRHLNFGTPSKLLRGAADTLLSGRRMYTFEDSEVQTDLFWNGEAFQLSEEVEGKGMKKTLQRMLHEAGVDVPLDPEGEQKVSSGWKLVKDLWKHEGPDVFDDLPSSDDDGEEHRKRRAKVSWAQVRMQIDQERSDRSRKGVEDRFTIIRTWIMKLIDSYEDALKFSRSSAKGAR
jgi:hypothetical protein